MPLYSLCSFASEPMQVARASHLYLAGTKTTHFGVDLACSSPLVTAALASAHFTAGHRAEDVFLTVATGPHAARSTQMPSATPVGTNSGNMAPFQRRLPVFHAHTARTDRGAYLGKAQTPACPVRLPVLGPIGSRTGIGPAYDAGVAPIAPGPCLWIENGVKKCIRVDACRYWGGQ